MSVLNSTNAWPFTEISAEEGLDINAIFGDSTDTANQGNPFEVQATAATPAPAPATQEMPAAPAVEAAAPMPAVAPPKEAPAPAQPESNAAAGNPIAAAFEQKTAENTKKGLLEKPPVFYHKGIKEDIEDAAMTFEELRIRKSEDFTDLEEGKRVSWSVEYCGIRKEIKDPKGTTIISMKETIERSREFLEALKKSKEKDPCCYVKPKVEMKTKGNAAYKGRFGTLEEARESDKVICLIPSRDGRIYELRKMEQGEFIAPKNNVVDFSEIRAGFIPALPKIPAQLMGEIIAFFRSFMTESEENEAMAQIYWDKAEKRSYVKKRLRPIFTTARTMMRSDISAMQIFTPITAWTPFSPERMIGTSALRGSTLSSEGSIISTRRSRPASSAATALFPLTPIRSSKGWSASFRESGWSRSASAGKRA